MSPGRRSNPFSTIFIHSPFGPTPMSAATHDPRRAGDDRRKTVAAACLVPFALMLVLAALPAGTAHEDTVGGYSLAATTDGNATITVAPVTGLGKTVVTVSVACEAGTVHDPTQTVPVKFEPTPQDDWAVLTVSATQAHVEFSAEECVAGKAKDVEVTVASQYGKEAPAFTTTTNALVAKLDDGTTAKAEWNEQVGFYDNHQTRFEQAIWKVEPGGTFFLPIDVQNFGNGDILVTASLNEETSDALTFTLPDPVVVPSPYTGTEGQTEPILLEVTAPNAKGYENRRDNIVLDITVVSADDRSIVAQPEQIAAAIQTQGWGSGEERQGTGELPAVGPLVVVGVLVALAAVRRAQP